MRVNIGAWALAVVLAIIISVVLDSDRIGFVGQLVGVVISYILSAAVTYIYVCDVRRQQVVFLDSTAKALPWLWLKYLGLVIWKGAIGLISLVLLIIPFFFIYPRLVLAEYYLVDQNTSILFALKASWRATEGQLGKIYGIFGAYVAMFLLAITIIGIPFAIYFIIMYSPAYALLYEFLKTAPAADLSKQR